MQCENYTVYRISDSSLLSGGSSQCVYDTVCLQPAVRQSATQTLNTWVEQTGLPAFVEAEIMSDALKLENPILRAEVCRLLPTMMLM